MAFYVKTYQHLRHSTWRPTYSYGVVSL
jgi:hypothetical protein